jgi:hypothetical protein
MDAATLAPLIAAHARFPSALEAVLPLDDVALMRERESDARWSPLEILVHFRDEEYEDFKDRAKAACEGRLSETVVDVEGWVTARAYNAQDPREVFDDFVAERARSVEWLRSLTAADLAREVEHPEWGTFVGGDYVAAWRVHDLLHLRQLAQALAVLTARRLKRWRVNYAGPIPDPQTPTYGRPKG